VTTLVNLGDGLRHGTHRDDLHAGPVFGSQPLGRAVLLGNMGAILGSTVSVRFMGTFGKRKYGTDENVLTEEEEGYDILRYREVRKGNVAQRTLQSLLDGGVHGVQTGLDITPGIIIIRTMVMMLAYRSKEGVYSGGAYEGIAFFPWIGVVATDGGPIRWMKVPGDPRNTYIARMDWAGDSSSLVWQNLNRLQNTNDVLLANAETGDVKRLHRDQSETWVEVMDCHEWLNEGKELLC